MKNLIRIFAAVAFLLASGSSVEAQSALLTNPASLAEFPAVERVLAATKGSDEVDKHARFMAALWRINDMIKEDLRRAPNGGYFDMPPSAQKVQYRYSGAITRFSIDEVPPAGRDPRFRPLEMKYEKDPAFFDDLLSEFFSSKFRTDYYAWIGKPVPARAASSVVAKGSSTSSDPSIAKAKAMKVDLTVFAGSITLGDQFSYPPCPPLEIAIFSSGPPESTAACDATDRKVSVPIPGLTDLFNNLPSGSNTDAKVDPNLREIELPSSSIPRWVSGTSAWVRLDRGRIVAVIFATKGLTVQKSASDDLIAKYGKAHYSQGGTFKTDGGREFKYDDRNWVLPGIRVEYDALMSDEDERSSVDGIGRVRIETESEYSRRAAEEAKPKKRVL